MGHPRLKVLIAALAMDVLLGEPPATAHPVVWMGRALDALEHAAPPAARQGLRYGLFVALGMPALWAAAAHAIERQTPWWVRAVRRRCRATHCLLSPNASKPAWSAMIWSARGTIWRGSSVARAAVWTAGLSPQRLSSRSPVAGRA
ncbi:MAG TPA: cobalamin biosynthesis protein [Chloroflexota bacterium]|nr:cobalamin biosynthesis protein [Chloroflexota bacterium]